MPTVRGGVGKIWVHVGAMMNGTRATVHRDVHIVHDETAIRFVGVDGRTPPRSLLRKGQSSPDVVALDRLAIPGLIDAHTHLALDGVVLDAEARADRRPRAFGELLHVARTNLQQADSYGLAGVRDAGDRHGVGLTLSAERKETGVRFGPYVDSPGAAIHHRGEYGGFMSSAIEECPTPAACVADRIARGADRIKIIATGIVDFTTNEDTVAPQMSTEELIALVDAARLHGRQVFAHASGAEGIDRVIKARVDSIEHGYFITDDQLERMRDTDIAWVPTFAPLEAQIAHARTFGHSHEVVANIRAILDRHAASLRVAHSLGVRVIAGSDAGSPGVAHGAGLHAEMQAMQAAGLSAAETIVAATGAGAERFAYAERIGCIAEGYSSRFLLVPLEAATDVGALTRAR